MDLLERYLQAVGQFLPAATREDTIAELRANLEEQMDGRAEEMGRPLSEAEVADVLRAHGRPEVVAARYLPQGSLIGPGLFPIYELTLRRGVGYVALVYAIVRGITLVLTPSGRPAAGQVVEAVLGLLPTLLYFVAIVTMVFAALEFAQRRYGVVAKRDPWDPAKLPPVKAQGGTAKRRSRAGRVAELVMHLAWMGYVLLLPRHPFLLMGPGAAILRATGIHLAPVWHVFYMVLLGVLTVQLLVAVLALLPGRQGWVAPLTVVKGLLNIVSFGFLVCAGGPYLVGGSAGNMERLAAVNGAMGVGFRFALLCAVVGSVVEVWKVLRRDGGARRVEVGSAR